MENLLQGRCRHLVDGIVAKLGLLQFPAIYIMDPIHRGPAVFRESQNHHGTGDTQYILHLVKFCADIAPEDGTGLIVIHIAGQRHQKFRGLPHLLPCILRSVQTAVRIDDDHLQPLCFLPQVTVTCSQKPQRKHRRTVTALLKHNADIVCPGHIIRDHTDSLFPFHTLLFFAGSFLNGRFPADAFSLLSLQTLSGAAYKAGDLLLYHFPHFLCRPRKISALVFR